MRFLARERRRLASVAQRRDRQGRSAEAEVLRGEVKRLKKEALRLSRASRRKHRESVEGYLHRMSSSEVFRRVRAATQAASDVPRCLRDADGEVVSGSEATLRVMKEAWEVVFNEEKFTSHRWSDDEWQALKRRALERLPALAEDGQKFTGDGGGAAEVTATRVKAALQKLAAFKAPGVDGIHPWMLKFAGDALVPLLVPLFSAMWGLCIIPAVWKKALVVPIFKKGDAADPSNYRPISELCVPGKLLSNILNDVLYGRLEEQGLIPDEQGGFRVGRGCPEMVFILHSVLLNRLRAGCRTYVAFVDVKKAYDTVCRPGLLLRLLELGTPEHVWALIREWYSGDSACIFMGGKQSAWFDTTLGVKQGDV